jgi:hypothetical protein
MNRSGQVGIGGVAMHRYPFAGVSRAVPHERAFLGTCRWKRYMNSTPDL